MLILTVKSTSSQFHFNFPRLYTTFTHHWHKTQTIIHAIIHSTGKIKRKSETFVLRRRVVCDVCRMWRATVAHVSRVTSFQLFVQLKTCARAEYWKWRENQMKIYWLRALSCKLSDKSNLTFQLQPVQRSDGMSAMQLHFTFFVGISETISNRKHFWNLRCFRKPITMGLSLFVSYFPYPRWWLLNWI